MTTFLRVRLASVALYFLGMFAIFLEFSAEERKPINVVVPNASPIEFVPIKAGSFIMGSDEAENKMYAEEEPAHKVTLTKDFYMAKYEITKKQFRSFMKLSGYEIKTTPDNRVVGWNEKEKEIEQPRGQDLYSWENPGFKQSDDHPVTCVSWDDAQAFCQWLEKNKDEKLQGKFVFDLPTEAEWEYCSRAGTTTSFYFDEDRLKHAKYENIADLKFHSHTGWDPFEPTGNDGYVYTSPVGSFLANPFGLFDMNGNVGEWCKDWYLEDYPKEAVVDPIGSETGTSRSIRGGDWATCPLNSRAASRFKQPPSIRYCRLGFRIVLRPHTKED